MVAYHLVRLLELADSDRRGFEERYRWLGEAPCLGAWPEWCRWIRRQVVDSGGRPLGTVVEVLVDLALQHPTHALVRRARWCRPRGEVLVPLSQLVPLGRRRLRFQGSTSAFLYASTLTPRWYGSVLGAYWPGRPPTSEGMVAPNGAAPGNREPRAEMTHDGPLLHHSGAGFLRPRLGLRSRL